MLSSAPNFLLSKQTMTTSLQKALLSVIMFLLLDLSRAENCEMFIRFNLEDQDYYLRACFGNKLMNFVPRTIPNENTVGLFAVVHIRLFYHPLPFLL
jgi:hypothetical protein